MYVCMTVVFTNTRVCLSNDYDDLTPLTQHTVNSKFVLRLCVLHTQHNTELHTILNANVPPWSVAVQEMTNSSIT